MRQLPDYCRQDDLVVPVISPLAHELIASVDPDAWETLTTLGLPRRVGHAMGVLPVLDLDDYFAEVVRDGGEPSGAMVPIYASLLLLVPPFRMQFAVAADGAVVSCHHGRSRVSVARNSTSVNTFLVLQCALRALDFGDRERLFEVLPDLGRLDPWAFTDASSPWPREFAESVFGDLSRNLTEEAEIRRTAIEA